MAKGKALELSIRIAGQMDKSLLATIQQTNRMLGTLTTTAARAGKVGLGAMAAGAAATAAALIHCTREAGKLETSMAPVARYVEGLADSSGKLSDTLARNANGDILNGKTYKENYEALRGYIQDLSTEIPRTTEQLAAMSAALGQSGKGVEEQLRSGVLRDTAVAATAMDLEDQTAGDYMAKWEAAFRFSHSQVMELMDQINYLGANFATTGAEIAQSVNQSASMGQIAGLDPAATAALATAMQATGVSTDRVGTSITRIYTNLSKGTSATAAMKAQWQELGMTAEGVAKAMQTDGTGTLLRVFQAIQDLPDERRVAALSTLFGQWAIEGGAKVTQNLELYTRALEAVGDPKRYTGSMEREFIIQAGTSESLDQMMGNARTALAQDMGLELLPVKKQLDLALIDLMNSLRKNTPALKTLAGTLADLLAGGINRLTAALDRGLPKAQSALDYLSRHGDGAARVLLGLAAAFGAMTLAPAAGGLLSGGADLLAGRTINPVSGQRAGGLLGLGGRLADRAGAVGQVAWTAAQVTAANGNGSLADRLTGGLMGALGALRVRDGLVSDSQRVRNKAMQSAAGFAAPFTKQGFGGVTAALGNSGPVRYVRNAAAGLGNLWANSGVIKDVLSGIAGPEGLDLAGTSGGVLAAGKNLAASALNGLRIKTAGTLAGLNLFGGIAASTGPGAGLVNAAGRLGGWFADRAPMAGQMGQVLGSMLGGAKNFAGAGAGLLANLFGPMLPALGGVFAGAAGPVAAISAVIAAVSLLGDHLGDLRTLVYSVFGPEAAAAVWKVGSAVQGALGFLNAVVHAGSLKELRTLIFRTFGADAAAAVNGFAQKFPGLTDILLSVLDVAGQIVDFSTGTVKPILAQVLGWVTGTALPLVLNTLSQAAPYLAGILRGVGTAVVSGMTLAGQAIQAVLPIVEFVLNALLGAAGVVLPAALAYFSQFAGGIGAVMAAAKDIFQGLLTFLSGVFTGNWSSIWQGIRQIFSSAFRGLAALVKTPINAVIALINQAIKGINSLGVEIPSWVPEPFGGKKFSLNIPQIPMLARGGFTNGVSIAGEAGREAVISFQRGVRGRNIALWQQAGRMLGVDRRQAAAALKQLPKRDAVTLKDPGDRDDHKPRPGGGGNGGSFVFAPKVIIQGNADKAVIDRALQDEEARFRAWYEKMERERKRLEY